MTFPISQVGIDGIVYIAPLVYCTPPTLCFHTTLESNVKGIRELGLRTGRLARKSTTGRMDCADSIYVSFDEQAARKWSTEKLLGKVNPGASWAIFRIDSGGLTKRVYRDPASQTGYILEDSSISPDFLELLCSFTQ